MRSSTPWEFLLIRFQSCPKTSSKPWPRIRFQKQKACPRSLLVDSFRAQPRETENLFDGEWCGSNHPCLSDGETSRCTARGTSANWHKGGVRRRRVRLVLHPDGRRARKQLLDSGAAGKWNEHCYDRGLGKR